MAVQVYGDYERVAQMAATVRCESAAGHRGYRFIQRAGEARLSGDFSPFELLLQYKLLELFKFD